jgi:hypothetical protein
MKVKTSELEGAALDWAVAKCENMTIKIQLPGKCGRPLYVLAAEQGYTPWTWEPSTSWHHGGPIIEGEGVRIQPFMGKWIAYIDTPSAHADGPTPLIAAMRCYVASKLGDEIEIPEELK